MSKIFFDELPEELQERLAARNPEVAAYRAGLRSKPAESPLRAPQQRVRRVHVPPPGIIRITAAAPANQETLHRANDNVHEAFEKLDLAYRQRNWQLQKGHGWPEPAVVALMLLAVFVLLAISLSLVENNSAQALKFLP